jgi:hypothetical protein
VTHSQDQKYAKQEPDGGEAGVGELDSPVARSGNNSEFKSILSNKIQMKRVPHTPHTDRFLPIPKDQANLGSRCNDHQAPVLDVPMHACGAGTVQAQG